MTSNRLRWMVGALVVCSVAAQAELVGHWRMGDGATFDGTNWTVPDLVASPANATSVNLVEANRVDGFPMAGDPGNQAMRLTAANGAYLSIGTPAKLNLTSAVSVCAWFNWSGTGTQGFHPLIGKGDLQYMLRFQTTPRFSFFTQDGSWHQVNSTTDDPVVVAGQWYFVVGICDGTNVTVYVNGVQGGTAAGGITADSAPVEIGRNSSNTARLADGLVDEVRVYNHALTQQEILDLYSEMAIPAEILTEPEILPGPYVGAGTDVTITVGAQGTGPLVYQWYKDAAPVGEGTNDLLDRPGVAVADSGDYHVVISNQFGSVTSQVVTLSVGAADAITFFENPAAATRYVGGSAIFSTIVVGAEPLALQWTRSGGVIAGATNDTLAVTDIATGDAGDYVLVASNSSLTNSSATATLTVLVPAAGSYAEAVVSSRPIAYWRLEESGGATAYEYMSGYDATHNANVVANVPGPRPPALPEMPADNVGAGYDGDAAGTETAASIMNARPAFTIMGWFNPAEMPQITTTNDSERVALFGQNDVAEFGFHGATTLGCWSPGGFVSFDPTDEVLVGDWHFIACTGDGTNMTLFLDAGIKDTITQVATNYGSSTSPFRIGSAVLDVTDNWFNGAIDEVAVFDRALSPLEVSNIRSAAGPVPPVVAVDPVDTTRYAGLTAVMNVDVAGTLPIDYQWRKDGLPLTDGGDISGATTRTLTISNLEAADQGAYDVVATNNLGTATSQPAALTVLVPTPGSYEAAVVNRKPIAYWRLNETTGLIGYDYAGGYDTTHADYSYVGDPGPQPPAFPGLEIDNVSVGWDGVDGDGSETSVGLMNNRPQFTIMGWMNTPELPAINVTGGNRVALFGQNDVAEFGFHSATQLGMWTPGGGFASVNPTNVVTVGEWVFLAVTGDGQNLRLYANGVLQSTAAGTVATYGSSSDPFRMGFGVLDATGNNFYGGVDEVAVFDWALAPSDIQDIYGLAADTAFNVEILRQPTGLTLYAGSPVAAEFSVLAGGTPPLTYSWRKDGSPLGDGSSISGTATDLLSIFPVAGPDQGSYDVLISNAGSSVTSTSATLTVIEPLADSYEEAVLALNPAGYWRLNEPTGSVVAVEGWNGRNGTYRSAAIPGVEGVTGVGFEPGNTAVKITPNLANADVSLPGLGFNTNTVTIACWLKTDGDQGGFRGLVFLRAGGTVSGMHFGNGNDLHYTWNDQYWSFAGPVVPTNEWVFAVLVVEPDQATLHLGANEILQSATNSGVHPVANFNNAPTYIGWDSNNVNRHFNGAIDEVMIFDRALSPSEVQSLYFAVVGEPVVITIKPAPGGNLTLSWPAGNILQAAPEVTGTWSEVSGAASPFTITPTEPQEFFRIAE